MNVLIHIDLCLSCIELCKLFGVNIDFQYSQSQSILGWIKIEPVWFLRPF